jgi:hypothetical protein
MAIYAQAARCCRHDIERRITYGAPSVEEWLNKDGL